MDRKPAITAASLTCLVLSACNGGTEVAATSRPAPIPILRLISPSSSPGYQNQITIQASNVPISSGSKLKIYGDGTCGKLIGTVSTASAYYYSTDITGSGTLQITLRGPGTATISAQSYDGALDSTSSCSTQNVVYTLARPPVPTSIVMVTPAATSGALPTPTVQVGGLALGTSITLYSDAGCSNPVSQAIPVYSSSINITTNALPQGINTLYAQTSIALIGTGDTGTINSACSTASVSYTVLPPAAPSGLALYSPSSSPSYVTQPSITVSGLVSGQTAKLYSDSACTALMGSANATGTSVNVTLQSPLSVGSYIFYATASYGTSASQCSSASVAYAVQPPPAPSSIALLTPSLSPSYIAKPQLQVGGVLSGSTVAVYTDSGCASSLGSATASGTTVNVTLSSSLALGSYTFYATQTYNSLKSSCSTANVGYVIQRVSAPSSLALSFPATSPGYSAKLQIQVGGTASGATVTLYSDSSCTISAGSGPASGSSANIAVNAQLSFGTSTYYANQAYNSLTSDCSSANVSYTYASPPAPDPNGTPALGQQSVAFQINPAHSGYTSFGSTLSFPATPTWSYNFNGTLSYPLIVNGRVFVTTQGSNSSDPVKLYSLDLTTGSVLWGPVTISGTYYWSGLTYDNGKVFVLNSNGLLRSYDAATGSAGWSVVLPYQYSFSATPTASNGTVYIGGSGSGGTLYAVSESNGALTWSASVANGDVSSPTVTSDGIFVSYPCQTYKFDPTTGSLLWHNSTGCSGGGGSTLVYANGALYSRDWGSNPADVLLDASTGHAIGIFSSAFTATLPAIAPTSGFFISGGTLRETDLSGLDAAWSFAGDGHLISSPIVVDSTVMVGSSTGKVYAVDAQTGTQLWSGSAGTMMSGSDTINGYPTGLAAAQNYLVVPAGNTLTAWKIAGP